MAQPGQGGVADFNLSEDEAKYIIRHVFLPLDLPQTDDYDVDMEGALLKAVIQGLSMWKDFVQDGQSDAVLSAITTMKQLYDTHGSFNGASRVHEGNLLHAFKAFSQEEFFELTPHNEAVISTQGRLRRLFPGSSIAIPLATFQSREFQATVAYALSKMSYQTAYDTKPRAKKGGQLHDEDRDTTHPKMITELFSAFLRSMGSPCQVSSIWKNTREEVFWQGGSINPWHRSALWLLVRVTLQLQFSRSEASSDPPEQNYKMFMLFFMATLLVQSRAFNLSSDILSAMSAKVSRRQRKLTRSIPQPLLSFVESTLSTIHEVLQEKWATIQEQHSIPSKLEGLRNLDFYQDTYTELTSLDEYVKGIENRKEYDSSFTIHLTCPLEIDSAYDEPKFTFSPTSAYATFDLATFESWVASNLRDWLGIHIAQPTTTGVLRGWIETYHEVALTQYTSNPEALSVMILTILELWIASDMSAIRLCRLLNKYDPEIPLSLLENLNLPLKRQMERLVEIEQYLKNRSEQATFSSAEVLRKLDGTNCFPVQYFNQSDTHKELFREINDNATKDREEKLAEYREIRQHYQDLIRRSDQSKHNITKSLNRTTGLWSEVHAHDCLKCNLIQQANELTIEIHEWPLPEDESRAKSTCFELQVPCYFGHWRDSTVMVLSDVLRSKYKDTRSLRAKYALNHPKVGLQQYFRFQQKQRILLMSENKPHMGTHRKMRDIITKTEHDVCPRNGLNFRYYDCKTDSFTRGFETTQEIAELCTYVVPGSSTNEMSPIQQFLFRPPAKPSGPWPNTVLATQYACPSILSLEEYKALASLPLGYRIQWQNILVQLASPSVDFKMEVTVLVALQCILQAGPCSVDDIRRDGHSILDDMQFAGALLDTLREALRRIEKNSQFFPALGLFVTITRRLLSLNSTVRVQLQSLELLSSCRVTAWKWMGDLEDEIKRATDDKLRDDLKSKAVNIALVCVDTFSVDDEHLQSLLASSDDACIFIQCSMAIQEGLHCISQTYLTSIMFNRWKQLAYHSFATLMEEIVNRRSTALDNAIRKLSPTLQASGQWRTLDRPYHHWLYTKSTPSDEHVSLAVYFSLLTGELLVNDTLINRLPADYEMHTTYSTLFGRSILEIVPSSIHGMRFSCKDLFHGHRLDFVLEEEVLSVRAEAEDHVFEFVPRSVLANSLPMMFLNDFVHWYNLDEDCLDFSPRENPWNHDDQNWKLLRLGTSDSSWQLVKGDKFIISMNSPTAKVTGTEQALTVLKSAAVKSFKCLTEHDHDLLKEIALLTPRRGYYPSHRRVMQTHGEFYQVFLYEDHRLLRRDLIRSSTFRVSGFGAEKHTTAYDHSGQANRSFVMSSIIFRESFSLHNSIDGDLATEIWNFLSHVTTINGARLLLDGFQLIAKDWIPLLQLLSTGNPRPDKFRMMLWLATLSFAQNTNMTIMHVLAAFFSAPEMAAAIAPSAHTFELSFGSEVRHSELLEYMKPAYLPYNWSPEAQILRSQPESSVDFWRTQQAQFRSNRRRALDTLSRALVNQWPCEVPMRPHDTNSIGWHDYIDVNQAMSHAESFFKPRYDNYRLVKYLNKIRDTIPRHITPIYSQPVSRIDPPWSLKRESRFVSNNDIFHCPAPTELLPSLEDMTRILTLDSGEAKRQTLNLPALLFRLHKQAQSTYELAYVEDLRSSNKALKGWRKYHHVKSMGNETQTLLAKHRDDCQKVVNQTYAIMVQALASSQMDQHGPRLSPCYFLERLTRNYWRNLPEGWRSCIIHYGVALTQLQRAERLLGAVENHHALVNELRNPGHIGWQPRDKPEWLLFEIEAGILIRPVQAQIAASMMKPDDSDGNVMMQLNMGEGKTNVIVPIVATFLADGSQLVRVIVGKPQSNQMYQVLVSKLGGLLGRRIYHMPFSRAVNVEVKAMKAMKEMFDTCKTTGGILLVQPEHILSYKLMGIECTLSGKDQIGRALTRSQCALDATTRDIVDESDENFSVKFELVYTVGTQHPTEHCPERWVCIHQVLDIIRKVVMEVHSELPTSIEVHSQCPGSFPLTRILQPDAGERILSQVAEQICATGLNGFPIARQRQAVREAVYRYIVEIQPTAADVALVESQGEGGFWVGVSQTLLLLRGLIAGGVLTFAFGHKRWRVDYGLAAANRLPETRLAVPYRAKDIPSPRSEFSHPDSIIILTSLSYYYGGLGESDLYRTFDHLLKSDQANVEYQVWVKDACNPPPALDSINLQDQTQFSRDIYPTFRYAKGVIDYFLSSVVFPKEMKGFPSKLSASGWDIGEPKVHATTGFSGTNDSRKVLPLHVTQLDLEAQKHTNALVLENLLRRENSVDLMPPRRSEDGSIAEMILDIIAKMEQPTRVILDVGAQILELLMLGEGQSIVFCVPHEIQTKIRALKSETRRVSDLDISVLDILAWTIGETWRDMHRSMVLWASQGRRNELHRKIWEEALPDGETDPGETQEISFSRGLAERYLEDEAQTLESKYRPRITTESKRRTNGDSTDPITLRCNEFKDLNLDLGSLHEEEERQIAAETERENNIERPPGAEPARHGIHSDVKAFVHSGVVFAESAGYKPAFSTLRRTGAGAVFDVAQLGRRLLVTNDFASTIKSSGALDSYQRSVQWILTSGPPGAVKHMMVISPFEAQQLLPTIEQSKAVALHIYAPRSNLGYRGLDKLSLYTVPEHLKNRAVPQRLITELNLFTGQLYFDSFDQYVDACKFLGIGYETPGEDEEIAADGFILRDSQGRVGGESGLESSPMAFFKVLHTNIRHSGKTIDKTHMGKLLNNQLLGPTDFEN
ncbi:hypothetical protein F4818DRAFT_454894 [Hypoxylon cercidicola]|nr:hypothetical protein F4818DRAFT_454894 [Hypoxylon cercidicola]